MTKIDGSVIQLHSTEPRQIDEPNQLTTLTGKELSFRESGQFLATYTMHGMDVSDHIIVRVLPQLVVVLRCTVLLLMMSMMVSMMIIIIILTQKELCIFL